MAYSNIFKAILYERVNVTKHVGGEIVNMGTFERYVNLSPAIYGGYFTFARLLSG